MLEILIQICNKLGVQYSIPTTLKDDCEKSKYLLEQINKFIG